MVQTRKECPAAFPRRQSLPRFFDFRQSLVTFSLFFPKGGAAFVIRPRLARRAGLSFPSVVDAYSLRLDHRFSNQLSLFGRYNDSPSSQRFRSFPSQENQFERNTRTTTIGATWAVSPRLVNELRFNYSTQRGLFLFAGVPVDGAQLPPDGLLFPSFAPRENSSVSLVLNTGASGVSSANLTQGKTLGQRQRQYNLVHNLTVVAGRHELKFGGDYRRLRPLQDTRSVGISYNFNTLASRANGLPTSISVQAFAPVTDFFVENFSAFAQDTWRVTPRLTLTLGTRWELNPPLAGDRLPAALDGLENPLTATLAPAGTRQWRTTYDNFAPRVGVAFTLSEKRNTVARGGFGIFYDTGQGTALRGYNSFPYNTSVTITNPALLRFPAAETTLMPPPFLDATAPPYSSNFFVFDRNLQLPYTRQWNLTLEQGLGKNQAVSIGYVAAAGRRLLRGEQLRNFNEAFVRNNFGIPNGSAIVQVNPSLFGPTPSASSAAGSPVNITRNAAESDYHSLQAQFQHRFSRGLQVLASYTYAKSTDDASDELLNGLPVNHPSTVLERSPSDFDIRHNFVAALSYNLPGPGQNRFARAVLGRWAADFITRARSAAPFTVITQAFDPLNIGTNRRVNLVAGQPVYLSDPNVAGGRRLNPAAFAQPAVGLQGTLGRNALRGFPVYQTDFALRREFALSEKLRVQFRGEMFNVFNHPNFGDPAASFGFSGFGVATSMLGRGLSGVGSGATTQTSPSAGFNSLYQVGGPRSIQFSLKLLY